MEVLKEESDTGTSLAKQVFASLLVGLLYIIVGFNSSYSSILVPQLLNEKNSSTIQTTSTETSWIVSANSLGTLLSGLFSGWVADRFGRVTTMKISSIPSVVGWVLIAMAKNADLIIVGRFISGFFISFVSSSVLVYVVEVSQPNIRGVLLSIASLNFSIGLFLMFLQGRFLHWRWIAWIIVGFTLIITALLFAVPESPPWLVSKNRIKRARKSLQWSSNVAVDAKMKSMIEKNAAKLGIQREVSLRTFTQPTVYKPFFILAGFFTLQRFTGVYIILSNTIVFFMKMGVTYDLYLITIFIGVTRIVMSLVCLWLSKIFNRRTLLCGSSLGMAASLCLSALATKWTHQDETVMWLPVVSIMLCFISAGCGLFSIPQSISAEMFPLNVRGVMQSSTLTVCNVMSFASLHSYNASLELFGGVVGLQYFYAIASLAFAVFTFVFIPETHNKKLSEIEEHFREHSTYL